MNKKGNKILSFPKYCGACKNFEICFEESQEIIYGENNSRRD